MLGNLDIQARRGLKSYVFGDRKKYEVKTMYEQVEATINQSYTRSHGLLEKDASVGETLYTYKAQRHPESSGGAIQARFGEGM